MPEIMFSKGLFSASPIPTESSPKPVMTRPGEAPVAITMKIKPAIASVDIRTIRMIRMRMRGARETICG